MSNSRIFSTSRYQPQGRNVNLAGTMIKRTPIFTHINPDKLQVSPFANYNCKTGQSFLSQSQTSIQEDRISPDAVRQMIKEQLSRQQSPEETNRKLIHTLQAQITDLKERISQYDKENNQKLHESTLSLKEDIRAETEKVGKQVQLQISTKLRSFFQKANLELKKDIMKIVQEQFLTIAVGQDFQNELQSINQKIQSINSFIANNKFSASEAPSKTSQSSIVIQNLETKLTKLQKELQQGKKFNIDIISKLRGLQQWQQEQKNQKNYKQLQQKLDHLREKSKSNEQQFLKKLDVFQLKVSTVQFDNNALKQKISDIQKQNQQQRMQFLDFNRKLSSRVSEQDRSQLATSMMINNNSSLTQKQLKQEGNTIGSLEGSNLKKNEKQKEQVPKKSTYQVDSEGYLMDGERKYLLTDEGNMIKLNQHQIAALINSNVIQIIEN